MNKHAPDCRPAQDPTTWLATHGDLAGVAPNISVINHPGHSLSFSRLRTIEMTPGGIQRSTFAVAGCPSAASVELVEASELTGDCRAAHERLDLARSRVAGAWFSAVIILNQQDEIQRNTWAHNLALEYDARVAGNSERAALLVEDLVIAGGRKLAESYVALLLNNHPAFPWDQRPMPARLMAMKDDFIRRIYAPVAAGNPSA